jgi:hypothetical protein
MTRSCLLWTFLLLTVGSLTPVYGQITPRADAYTNTAAPTTNYGAQPLLNVNGATEVTFVAFNLASIPSGATISKATLKLYVNSVTTAGSFNIDYVNGAWTESKIDQSNAPALGSAIASSIPITTTQKNQYVLVDITSAVQAWQNGSQTNDGIALVANGVFNVTFDSKENTTTSHPPEVDVVIAGGGGGGTITGVTTSSSSGLQGGGTSGKLNLSLNTSCASGQGLAWNGSAWVCQTFKGNGSVTSVGLVAPSPDFTVTDSPVTGSGNLVLSWSGSAPTPSNVANAIVKRDSTGSFSANSITSAGTIITGTLGVNGNAVVAGVMGIGTNFAQAELNLNAGGTASADTLLIGNNTSKGLQMRDNGSGVDLESFGVPLFVNFLTQQQIDMGPAPNPSSLAALNVGAIHSVIDGHDYYNSAEFSNDVYVDGSLVVDGGLLVAGTKNFHIDHPLDPTNKYLNHASIESSEVLNQYSGNVVLDARGEAQVKFPAWFGAINDDFRYQLTAIGAPGPNLYIAEKVRDNSFKIGGGMPGMEVSWLVTARRNDPYMRAHPYVVEQDKPERERGYYTDPSLYGAPNQQGIFSKRQITAKKR